MTETMTARYRRYPAQEVKCDRCNVEQLVSVSVDTLAGVACFTCQKCGKISEC